MLDFTPGFTAIPNYFLDQIASTLTAAELRVALYIYRHTIGYQKLTDAISYSQFTDGITTTDGRKLDAGAGVSRRSLPAALAGLERKEVIRRSGGGNGGAVRYSIVQTIVPPEAKATGKSPQPVTSAGTGPEQPAAAPLTTPRPGQNLPAPAPASQADPEVPPREPQPQPGQKPPQSPAVLGQKLPETALQLGQILPPTKETESNIKPDRAAVAFVVDNVADITPRQAEKLVSMAMRNQRDISYISRLVGYVTSVAGNPAAMLTVLINRNEDRTTTGPNQPNQQAGAIRYINRQTGSQAQRRNQPIDFSKPIYQRFISEAKAELGSHSNLTE